jgi:uncharacterized RDD family membrane protein YckC
VAAASPGSDAPPAPRPAGLARRLAALFYDGLLLMAVFFVATVPVLFITGGEGVPAGDPLFRAYLFLVCFLYFAIPWLRGGQTLGMKTWRIRVERADGAPLRPPDALMRFVVSLASAAVLGLGFLWILLDPERRAWHDRAAGTRVVLLPRLPKRAGPAGGRPGPRRE